MKVTYAMPVKAAPPERVPRVARLLALAHKFQGMLDRCEVESMAELARLGRVSRARITQIMNLLLLAPEIQEEVLFGVAAGLRELLVVAHKTAWQEQRSVHFSCGHGGRGRNRMSESGGKEQRHGWSPIPDSRDRRPSERAP